jgi:hypothetical protein
MTYLIIAQFKKSSTPWCSDECVIDSADDLGYARLLAEQYHLAYGPWYKVFYRRKST